MSGLMWTVGDIPWCQCPWPLAEAVGPDHAIPTVCRAQFGDDTRSWRVTESNPQEKDAEEKCAPAVSVFRTDLPLHPSPHTSLVATR